MSRRSGLALVAAAGLGLTVPVTASASNGLYATGPGWDYVTGFGTPRVSGLICDLDAVC